MNDVTLYICETCTTIGAERNDEKRDGQRLFENLQQKDLPENIHLQPVRCLSACKDGCNIALTAPDCWSYVYSQMDPDNETQLDDIIAGATAYRDHEEGVVPWKARPEIFRKQSIARIPPMLSVAAKG